MRTTTLRVFSPGNGHHPRFFRSLSRFGRLMSERATPSIRLSHALRLRVEAEARRQAVSPDEFVAYVLNLHLLQLEHERRHVTADESVGSRGDGKDADSATRAMAEAAGRRSSESGGGDKATDHVDFKTPTLSLRDQIREIIEAEKKQASR